MPELICDTSPIQYLYQTELLHILPTLAESVVAPPAVVDELAAGRQLGVSLPDVTQLDWISIRKPSGEIALPLVNDLGPGEAGVLMLALESRRSVAVLDDVLARRVAETLHLRFTGALGLLLDAKSVGLIQKVGPILDQLDTLRFRVSPQTRRAVLTLAGEDHEEDPE